jgi:hypothetical protein
VVVIDEQKATTGAAARIDEPKMMVYWILGVVVYTAVACF